MAWLVLHTLTGKPEPFNQDHMVRVFEFQQQTSVATADGKTTIVRETVEDIMEELLAVEPPK